MFLNFFKIRCTIQKKVCDIIVDSGSTENIVSRSLIKALILATEKHPHPYRVGWIKKGTDTQVTEVCRISFSIGKFYQDEITCDVLETEACHLLLD